EPAAWRRRTGAAAGGAHRRECSMRLTEPNVFALERHHSKSPCETCGYPYDKGVHGARICPRCMERFCEFLNGGWRLGLSQKPHTKTNEVFIVAEEQIPLVDAEVVN